MALRGRKASRATIMKFVRGLRGRSKRQADAAKAVAHAEGYAAALRFLSSDLGEAAALRKALRKAPRKPARRKAVVRTAVKRVTKRHAQQLVRLATDAGVERVQVQLVRLSDRLAAIEALVWPPIDIARVTMDVPNAPPAHEEITTSDIRAALEQSFRDDDIPVPGADWEHRK